MIKEKTITDFTWALSSKEPVPGGGGASALAGALGAALASMVGSLTSGKKRYADVQADIDRLQHKTSKYIEQFLDLIDADAHVFLPLSQAYSLPYETNEQKAHKDKVMEQALNLASSVPLQIIEKTHEMLELLSEYAQKGSKIAISDVAVSAAMLRAAVNGASVNVYINTKAMKNRENADKTDAYCDKLVAQCSKTCDEIFEKVKNKLR